ncbi:hypothetical protein E1B28_002018 [Marasmius oreades]|uniref:Uncharacterized protein n=1 Tax=Marasmius oreades TaxID=181124 RepID=A0A9P8AG40_9AGAR|nr:uncharacterized protein E1B28_002018 [Marasmius oreades]KAG7100244.1 hypothetical protein E1B28_002018 [Marasmius oreades]
MISLSLFLSALAFSPLVRTQATPTEPGPGTVFRQGQTCRTVWTGDKDGKWGNMAVELMTGSDLQMVHLTTVGEGLDGNKDGKLEFDCPEVNPYSAIYFLQFSAPEGSGFQWATRFTIADKDGNSVPPPEDTQPNGKKIGWGNGKLVDEKSAKPPPSFQTQANGGTSANSTTTSGTTTPSSNTIVNTSGFTARVTTVTTSSTGTGAKAGPTGGSTSGSGSNNDPSNNGNTANTGNNNSTGSNNQNGAVSVALSNVPWQATLAVVTFSGAAALFL